MATHKSALKRAKQDEVKRIRNKSYKSRVKKAIKEVRAAIADNSPDQAEKKLSDATSLIQKTVSKGAIHKRQASRRISRLARQINGLRTS
ncbi:MAG: 30S ribosomal protein S20 [Desulfobacteraceae bacterium]|nr:30S ribosomal protein S20 [Desulfobacteraceae bacterium]